MAILFPVAQAQTDEPTAQEDVAGIDKAEDKPSSKFSEPGVPGGGSSVHTIRRPNIPLVEWEKSLGIESRLQSFGTGLMGDGIDPNTGGIGFTQTDIIIPGNSGLEVALRRRRSQGYLHHEDVHAEFGDWGHVVPRLTAITAGLSHWSTNRCTNSLKTSFPLIVMKVAAISANEYSQGVTLEIPGESPQNVLERINSKTTGRQWPSSARYVTTNNWYLTCLGNSFFYAVAPNGDRYRFDRFYKHKYKALGTQGSLSIPREKAVLAATEVTDVDGNWVRYSYDRSNRLTRIYANDGRSITLEYSGSSKLVRKVIANGRTWTYSYRRTKFRAPEWDRREGHKINSQILSRVTLPDGRYWSFELDDMFAEASPPYLGCAPSSGGLRLKHPSGAEGSFSLYETSHRAGTRLPVYNARPSIHNRCPSFEPVLIEGLEVLPPVIDGPLIRNVVSVAEKRLTGPGLPTMRWKFYYEQDKSISAASHDDLTNSTRVEEPDGREVTYFHYQTAREFGGRLQSMEVRQGRDGDLLERVEYTYVKEASIGRSFAPAGPKPGVVFSPNYTGQVRLSRDGKSYHTQNTYNNSQISSDYSWGNPVRIERSSSLQPAERITDITYTHNKSRWILGLPTSVERNGKTFEQMGYDSLGRMTWFDKFGIRQATMTYHSDGNLHQYRDALGRETSVDKYYRGVPQRLRRADRKRLYRTVDANGWVTSQTDAKGVQTKYRYNEVGWLTRIDRPSPWYDTLISYHNLGASSFYQRIARGSEEKLVWHDGFHRPYLTRTGPLRRSGATSHIRTRYDALGRVVFQSLPSTSSTASAGVETTYDALGRVTRIRENMPPYATTTTSYLSRNRIRMRDPLGHVTTITRSGYGSPDDGNPVLIEQPEKVKTAMTHDIYGNIVTARQYGSRGGSTLTRPSAGLTMITSGYAAMIHRKQAAGCINMTMPIR